MNKPGQRFGALLLGAGLCTAGWVYGHEQAQQAILLREIAVVDAALVTNNQQAARQEKSTVRYLASQTCRNYNHARDVAVLNQSQQILSRTQTLTDTLRELRRHLPTTGGTIITPELERHLDRYSDFIRTYAPGTLHLTREFAGAPDPGWLNRLYFEQMPVAATRATLTKLEALIHRNATDALSSQAQKVPSCCLYFTRISALAVPASETVAPGREYQARLFLAEAMWLNPATMELTANGRHVPMDQERALGRVAFPVPPAAPGQPDTVRARWHATIRAQICPTDTLFQLDVPYLIVKPSSLK